MSISLNSISNIGYNSKTEKQNVSFRKNPITHSTDIVEISNKKSKNIKTAKIAAFLALTGIATLVGVITHKQIQVKKAVKAIDTRFDKLKENIPEAQKIFKDVFMKDNLTEKETIELLEGYRELEKKRVKLSNKKYAKEVFNFAKKNFDIHNQSINLSLEAHKEAFGCCDRLNSEIRITPKCIKEGKNKIFETVHHELRHAKQNELIYHKDPAKLEHAVAHNLMAQKYPNMEKMMDYIKKIKEKTGTKREFDKRFLDEVDKDFHFRDLMKKNFGEQMPEKITKENEAFVDKLSTQLYSTLHYENRTEEIDAFKIAKMIKDFILK